MVWESVGGIGCIVTVSESPPVVLCTGFITGVLWFHHGLWLTCDATSTRLTGRSWHVRRIFVGFEGDISEMKQL